MNTPSKFWAIVPAAGIGKRMQSTTPKQYLTIEDKTILQITLEKLSRTPRIEGIVVAIDPKDQHHLELHNISRKIIFIEGGKERADSVLNGLKYLHRLGHGNDWALVHDAARPCVEIKNIESLMTKVESEQKGAILAVPVADTLKRVTAGQIKETISREGLWQAHTPQIFPLEQLLKALSLALANGDTVTDEASAMEYMGVKPLIVMDSRNNFKITRPEDLEIAKFILLNNNDS